MGFFTMTRTRRSAGEAGEGQAAPASRVDLPYLINLLLLLSLLLAARGFFADVSNTVDYGGVDLRNRVVGVRVALRGMDPYHFKWSYEYPDTLLDPLDDPESPVTRLTVAPTVLLFHAPFSGLAYEDQRYIWFLVQWLLLLGGIFLLSKCAPDGDKAKVIWIIGLFFSATHAWRYHVERGQVYVLYFFLIALAFWLSRKGDRRSLLAGGLVLGIAATLRPTLPLLALPFLFFRKKAILGGMLLGALLFLLLSLAFFGFSTWNSYVEAMPRFEYLNLGDLGRGSLAHPELTTIEGMDNLITNIAIPPNNSSIQFLLNRYLKLRLHYPVVLALLALLVLLPASLLLYRYRKASPSLACIFLLALTLYQAAEHFLPASKNFYSDVIWIVPLSMIALEFGRLRTIDVREVYASFFFLVAAVFFNLVLEWESACIVIGAYSMTIFFVCMSALLLSTYGAPSAAEPAQERGGETAAG